MNHNWVAIYGKLECAGGVVTHVPTKVGEGGGTGPTASPESAVPHTLARSNIIFERGQVSMEVWLEEPDARCQFGIAGMQGGDVYAGINSLGAAYGFGIFRNGKWEPGGGTGFGDKPLTKQWLKLALSVRGSSLDLYYNDVKVASASISTQKGPLELFFQSVEKIEVRNIKVESEDPVCFIVMQFTAEFNTLYKEVIKPTCESFGYKVVRADDFFTSGLIVEDITRSIRDAALVIADITPNNPNVYYEVGYAHGIGKPTILLSDRQRDRLPFDLSGFRTLFYDNTIGGKSAVEESLTKHLQNVGA